MKTKGNKPFVLFAHDGRFYSEPVKNQLTEDSDFVVKLCEDANQVLCYFGIEITKPDVFVTDGRLAHGNEFSNDVTQDGLITGTALYSRIRMQNSRLPIIIFTTHIDERERLNDLNDPYLKIIKAESTMGPSIMEAIRHFFPTDEDSGIFPDGWGKKATFNV